MPVAKLISSACIVACVPILAACNRNSEVPKTWQGRTSLAPTSEMATGATKIIAGERLSFRLKALGFDAGELVMAAGQPGEVEGKEVIYFRSRSVSKGVVALLKTVTDDVTTWIDLATGKPIYHRRETVNGDETEGVEIRFAAGTFDFEEWYDDERKKQTQVIPTGQVPYDMTSAMMRLRGWNAEAGETASFFVLRSTRFWQVNVEYHGKDSVRTSLGRFPAVRVDGVTRRYEQDGTLEEGKEPRYFSMWFSDDEQRLPLKIAAKTDYGDITMELVEYTGGGRELALK